MRCISKGLTLAFMPASTSARRGDERAKGRGDERAKRRGEQTGEERGEKA
jgi:hypothetical protein